MCHSIISGDMRLAFWFPWWRLWFCLWQDWLPRLWWCLPWGRSWRLCSSSPWHKEAILESEATSLQLLMPIVKEDSTKILFELELSVIILSRPTLSQLWSFKIRHTTILNYMKLSALMILRLSNSERTGRGAGEVLPGRTFHGEPYFVRHSGLLNDWMEFVRHFNFEGWKMSDSFILSIGRCPTPILWDIALELKLQVRIGLNLVCLILILTLSLIICLSLILTLSLILNCDIFLDLSLSLSLFDFCLIKSLSLSLDCTT